MKLARLCYGSPEGSFNYEVQMAENLGKEPLWKRGRTVCGAGESTERNLGREENLICYFPCCCFKPLNISQQITDN